MPDDRPEPHEPHRWNIIVELVDTTSSEAEAVRAKFLEILGNPSGKYGEATVRLSVASARERR